ncbi:MAG: fumarate hydratase [Polyangiaceae bacterium UTPRO1]|jgi:fumarate hydratase class I|nr:fumarate hydratase [Myxococcales bacterium]OQY67236.1 MAG: fumarate hydratase [Polyangiaceae bacterium UTPRO1]
MPDFRYQEMFPHGPDTTPYRKLAGDWVGVDRFRGERVLAVETAALTRLAFEAVRDVSHLFRPGHLAQLRRILEDPEASMNDRFVALNMLRNACVSAAMVLPSCQDTGTAIVIGKKGQRVWTGGGDEAALARGIYDVYQQTNLRYSQMAPLSTFTEKNTATNLPAQLELYAADGDEYRFLFVTKGGGSANKSFLYQETAAILSRERLLPFIEAKVKTLGTAACPPYHLAIVIGGTSAEATMKTVKLASCRDLDDLPTRGDPAGHAIRDPELEDEVWRLTQRLGIGAQFGGKYFCHDVRVIRLPRHGASLPIGIGVSCSADRQAKAKITAAGVFLEELETNPARHLPEIDEGKLSGEVVKIDLRRPMSEIRAALSRYPIKTRLALTGPMIVARDLAHAKLRERIERGEGLPQYVKDHPIYYAGPAKTPPGMPSGSFGPTTAGRMDGYVDLFMQHGGSLVTLAKGNRSPAVTEACKKHGGFYLGSIGGPAAILARDNIRKVEVLEYPELGMEAIWRIEVEDFPAFIVVDDKGNDFFGRL